MKSVLPYFLVSLSIILIDQVVKLSVHYTMEMGIMGEIKLIGDFFKLHYTLNPGMAFGIELGSNYGKLILTLFRFIAGGAIGFYIYLLVKEKKHPLYIFCISMVLGGAIGNVVDSTFYGVFLENAPYGSPTPWFHGQVIDMFYIDIWEGYLPSWIPIFGDSFVSLWPIFNVADASIFIGVTILLLFQKKFYPPTE